jgi:hypothetical protein
LKETNGESSRILDHATYTKTILLLFLLAI